MSELKELLESQNTAFTDFKGRNDERFAAIEKALKIANRPGAGGDFKETEAQAEYKKAFFDFVQRGDESGVLERRKALNITTPGEGGYAIPTHLEAQLNVSVAEQSAIRALSTIKKLETGDYQKIVNIGGAGSGWVGEAAARPETDTPDLVKLTPYMGEIYCNPAATQQMLDDAQETESWLKNEIFATIAGEEAEALISGNAVNKPKGILTYTTAEQADSVRAFGTIENITANSATLPTSDELIALSYCLASRYRSGATWVMNSNTAAIIRKMRFADDGHYIWEPRFNMLTPENLLGYPVFFDENMPDIGAGLIPIMFGNFKKGSMVCDRNTGILRDPYTNKPYVHLYCTKRVGNLVQDSKAIKFFKMAA